MYSLDDLIAAIKANIESAKILNNEDLLRPILAGKRRLDKDRPNFVYVTIAGTGARNYPLSAYADWLEGYSHVDHINTVVGAQEESSTLNPGNDYRLLVDSSGSRLYFPSALAIGRSVSVFVATPWILAGLDDAYTTTISESFQNPLEFICTAHVALALAGKSAGSTESQLPGDLLNYRSKEQEYRRIAREFEDKYQNELGLPAGAINAVKGAIVRGSYTPRTMQNGQRYLTHRSY